MLLRYEPVGTRSPSLLLPTRKVPAAATARRRLVLAMAMRNATMHVLDRVVWVSLWNWSGTGLLQGHRGGALRLPPVAWCYVGSVSLTKLP
jgi:hypothetical protein